MPLREAFEAVREWASIYVLHRDIAYGRIADVQKTPDGFRVANKDGTATLCVVKPDLRGMDAGKLAQANENSTILFTLSNGSNITEVCNRWNVLSGIKGLLVVFTNPISTTDDKWLLKPHLHDKVCDRASLLRGLNAMAELVEPITEDALAMSAQAGMPDRGRG
ncbi:TPA: hypothetical protein HA231_05110 [Candidatus Woesearchaeota archaeon]|nr:hypothetical protein [Candidatus Woesearchaeota archaeon]